MLCRSGRHQGYGPMRYLALIPVAVFLGGCPAPMPLDPVVQIVEVKVPFPVPCNPVVPPEEAYPDTAEVLSEVTNIEQGVRLLLSGRELRTLRIGQLDAAIDGCQGDE